MYFLHSDRLAAALAEPHKMAVRRVSDIAPMITRQGALAFAVNWDPTIEYSMADAARGDFPTRAEAYQAEELAVTDNLEWICETIFRDYNN
jgi:hypothetical protein